MLKISTKGKKLALRRKKFVDAYMIALNGTEAALAAGYSKKGACVAGSRLLANPEILAEITKRQAAAQEKTGITHEMIIAELAKMGFSNMSDYMKAGKDGDPHLDFSGLTRDQAAALTEVTVEDYVEGRGKDARDVKRVKFKLADKRAALVDIGRHIGMFKAAEERQAQPQNLSLTLIQIMQQAAVAKPPKELKLIS